MSGIDELRRPNEPCQQCGHGETAHEPKCRIRGCPCSRYYASSSSLEDEITSLRARVEALTAERDAARTELAAEQATSIRWMTAYDELKGRHERDMVVFNQNIVIAERLHAERDAARQSCDQWRSDARAAESALSRVRALHKRVDVVTMGGTLASVEEMEASRQPTCENCNPSGNPWPTWPCSTVAAIETPGTTERQFDTSGRCIGCGRMRGQHIENQQTGGIVCPTDEQMIAENRCKDCGRSVADVGEGSEFYMSGMCQECLNGPLPATPGTTT